MFLALRDLRFARGRFLLMGTVIALISVLAAVLTGLSSGLARDGVSALRALPVTHFAFQRGVEGDLYSRSTVPADDAAAWAKRSGVRRAAAYGNQLAHAKVARTGQDLDIAVFGMDPGSFIAPRPATGRPLGAVPDGVLISSRLADDGVKVGDTLRIERSGAALPVIGTVGDQSFTHVAVVYAPLRTWQRVHYGLPGTPPEQAYHQATAIALDAAPSVTRAGDAQVVTKEKSYSASPGFAAETATMTLIKVFLYLISMLVVAAFFVVWTVQRKGEIALVRALGGFARYLARDAVAQVLAVLVPATAAGTAAGIGITAALHAASRTVPVALEAAPLATAAALLIVLGVLGAVVTLRRVTSVDPLAALGGSR
ncbi:FtsX-like permease family protein [Actinomadura montaniterrae]|uniref:ABC transporter permease n=1 Tax=Actinomadura montaniterrae TaxID=1803903 RepID=A0A6L3VBY8_9ACTN|nr:ABC transporter permease [Actinomadura montaniterrae]KAB2353294.1 ABC transporter permease [Actinomadura montaniterrae]